MLWIFAAVGVIICLVYQVGVIFYPYSMDYGEAPLVDQAMRLAAGENIYRADLSTPPYTISNYPPLYVAVIALAAKFLSPPALFAAGRIISALSTWVAAISLGLVVYSSTRDRIAGLLSGAVFVAFPFVTFWSPLLRIDMFALALSTAGLSLLVRQPAGGRQTFWAALLLTAAIFTRQSYALAAPLAAFVWSLGYGWRRAINMAVMVGGLTLTGFLVLNVVTGGGFYYNIVTANINEFGMDRLQYNLMRFLDAAFIPVIIGGLSLFLARRRNPLWLLAAPYLVGAALSALTIGKIGSNVNYFLELCAALSLAVGVVTAWSRTHLTFASVRAGLFVALALGLGHMIKTTLLDTGVMQERREMTAELRQLEAFIAETPGDILADEFMGMLTLQGRPLMIQPFEVTQMAKAGVWDQTPLIESINNREFSAIILYDKPWSRERWTKEMLEAVNRSYRLSGLIAGNKIYTDSATTSPAAGLKACPGAAWQLPSDGSLGLKWRDGGLDFFGQGPAGKIPVFAAADGLLTRQADWFDGVAILHDDPLHPAEKVWSFYGGLGAANGTESYVAKEFPPGTINAPVKAGQIVGYQGSWSGKPLWSTWTHAYFFIVSPVEQDVFPEELSQDELLDPTPYLNLALLPQVEEINQQELKCGQP